MTDEAIIDLRVYKLKPGSNHAFAKRFRELIGPMLKRHGISVVRFGQSLIDPDSFCLIRSFQSIEERERKLAGFYGSEEWLEQHEDAVMAMIASYNVCVMDRDGEPC